MTNKPSSMGHRPQRDQGKENFWRRTIQQQAAGGQNIRAFCRANQLAESSFHFWRRCLARRDREGGRRPTAPQPPAFVELLPRKEMPVPADVPLEVVTGSRRLLIRNGCDRALLRDVLALLEA